MKAHNLKPMTLTLSMAPESERQVLIKKNIKIVHEIEIKT